tara:strand:+ start:212187 stop:212420 length:234 start_codon:yes stop_codon:yes gene_type:complete
VLSAEFILTLIGFLAGIAFCVFASHRAGKPYDDMKPKRLPWHLIMVLAAFFAVIMLVHMINIFGYETGPENSLLGRR